MEVCLHCSARLGVPSLPAWPPKLLMVDGGLCEWVGQAACYSNYFYWLDKSSDQNLIGQIRSTVLFAELKCI